jgi:hypothetical protein
MSTWNAGEKAPSYSLDFYNGSTLVGSVPRTQIVSLELQRTVFSEKPTVGQANAGELDATFIVPTFAIPRMAKVKVTLVYDGTTYTLGVFYIDTRYQNPTDNTLTIHCYDAMLMAEQAVPSTGTDISVLGDIATQLQTTLDASVTAAITNAYEIPSTMASDSSRDVLQAIGAAYGGSFFITRDGLLGFAGFSVGAETFYLCDEFGNAITFGGDRILV